MTGRINCLIELSEVNQGLSKVWVHDPSQSADSITVLQSNLEKTPSGICSAVIPNGTHTTIHWKKTVYSFSRDTLVGYDRLNFNQDTVVSWDPTKVTAYLTIWPGDYFVWNYKEEAFWTGYDLWYFLGMMGGVSFLLLVIHQCIWFPAKRIIYGDHSGVTFGYDSNSHDSIGSGSGSDGIGSGPRYANL